ncbi:group II intron maturase-specific domain-containing protein [Nonomuraea sp. NPDC051941]|uniref:group II intron maturase-specific domain-containing protein n=1 Tax=Nonomuraea sp. NPDC051941 TaxID=3364373 RepID=UPI0037CA98D2
MSALSGTIQHNLPSKRSVQVRFARWPAPGEQRVAEVVGGSVAAQNAASAEITSDGFTCKSLGQGGDLCGVPARGQQGRPQEMGAELRSWRIHLRTTSDLGELARWMNPVIRGWIAYLLWQVLPDRAERLPQAHQPLPDAGRDGSSNGCAQ